MKLVVANERAFELGKRYCDTDLNRCFPGDPESDLHEERLAPRLKSELQGLKILDIHSSESKECPFEITVGHPPEKVELTRSTGLEKLIDMEFVDGDMTQDMNGVIVECGFQDDKTAAGRAFRIMKNFLAAEGVIEAEHNVSDPEIFKVFGKEEGSGFSFVAKNFEKVKRGEVFAKKKDKLRKAEEEFYPVLMSTDGYDDMIGFKARKVEK